MHPHFKFWPALSYVFTSTFIFKQIHIYIYVYTYTYLSFTGSSAGKESAYNAGDLGLIPGCGRSPGERIGYPPQYSWASLVMQMVKNLLATRETWVWSLGQEDPLEEGLATHSRILAWRIPWTEGPGGLQSRGSQRVRLDWATKHSMYISFFSVLRLTVSCGSKNPVW